MLITNCALANRQRAAISMGDVAFQVNSELQVTSAATRCSLPCLALIACAIL